MSRSQPPQTPSHQSLPRSARFGSHGAPYSRMRTPVLVNGDAPEHAASSVVNGGGVGPDGAAGDDPRLADFKRRYAQSEARLMALFAAKQKEEEARQHGISEPAQDVLPNGAPPTSGVASRKAARKIDEDDYGDEEEEEEDETDSAEAARSPSKPGFHTGAVARSIAHPLARAGRGQLERTASIDPPKAGEDSRSVAEDAKTAEERAKRNFHTFFYTLEHDQVAMLEQHKLDELDRQVEAETSGQPGETTDAAPGASQQGSLSASNLGSSSLMLKNLLKRIDEQRSLVHANDAQLRRLISEVRKNRSKWASEEKIGQEELYESTENILQQIKSMTEYSGPFLQRVSKREAPDYYNFIKNPMDIGTMLKKLKTFVYKSRKEVVDDLYLIWDNCLKYNTDPNHPLRKKALYLQKRSDELVKHIPEIVVRDRAEVEAEERRNALDAELDGLDDSEDDAPLASRGRKAPSKSTKGGPNARKAPPVQDEAPDVKPILHSVGSSSNLKNQFLRADPDVPMENGLSTPPPPGRATPALNGIEAASQADASESDAIVNSLHDMSHDATEDPGPEDPDFVVWKQVTKRARAAVASQRHRLFKSGSGNSINGEEPALLRSRAAMRQWMRQQKKALGEEVDGADHSMLHVDEETARPANETLAEAMEEDDDTILPDYYNPLSAIPNIDPRLRWEEDTEGNVVMHGEETLRMLPPGHFTSPESALSRKIEANMRQIQETRKVTAKIGVVKQMQLQSQMYSNQFQKYEPVPFIEQDAEAAVVSDDGPFMAPWVCRATFQRSIAKIFYHAGFEEFQPSALDAVTDVASTYFQNLVQSMAAYSESARVRESEISDASENKAGSATFEENVLHALDEQGLDVDALESYVRDDVERLGTKLGVMHERMKAHLADLLRPALDPSQVGQDGVGAFNDNSEQFASGDFAEEIGEDFFGFKELGLDSEFSMTTLSVPFHLLHSRMHNAFQANTTTATTIVGDIMKEPAPFEPVTIDSIREEVGIIHNFFLEKLAYNNDRSLVEDDDLPLKQRFPKPRLPPTGKITSPRKRPLREQQQMAKKKRKLEELNAGGATGKPSKLRLDMPPPRSPERDPEKEEDAPGMMSPESM